MKCDMCNGTGKTYYRLATETKWYEEPCRACNGTGELKEPAKTNYERITKNPEALAKVIMRIVTSSEAHGYNGYCLFDDFDFDEFMKAMKDYDEEVGTKTEYEHYKEVLMWLKQESTE